MSTEKEISNGTEKRLSKNSETSRCSADAILNGCAVENITMKHSFKSKYYKSLFDYCTKVADELPQRQAFYAVDLEDVLWKVQEWKKCLPKVEIFYAVKANTDPVLLRLLTKLGLSFDCASSGEIKMVLEAGASPKDIIFAHTIKTVEELKFASEKGVELMTFDNEDELLKIQRVYPNAKLLIRIAPTVVNCSFDLSEKFGCTGDNAVRLLKLARQLNLNVIGISFHVGALCTDPTSYTSTIETCKSLFDVARDIGFKFSILDIGGGFFGTLEAQNIFYKMADNINKALEEYFPEDKVRIIAEPGTYIVGSAFSLICTVLGRRCIDNAVEGNPKRLYYLNDGVYCSFFRDIHLYGVKPIPILAESEIESRPKYESRLYGQTCCSEDVIMKSVVLPELKVGERITWCNMGAYCLGVSSTFCGVPLPIPRYVFEHKQRLNTDWIPAEKSIVSFLKSQVSFIGCTEDDI